MNDLMPSPARDHYHFVQTLKDSGCQLNAVLFREITIFVVASGDEIQSRNAGVVQKLTDMPKYHSRAIRQKFVSLFGRMVDVKPAYLCEMYCETLLQLLVKLRAMLVNV